MHFPDAQYQFEDFVEMTGRVLSRDHLFEVFQTTMAAYGFDRINFSVRRDDTIPRKHVGFGLIITYPDDWQKYYAERKFIEIDPVLRCASGTNRPFRWRDLERKASLSARQHKFLRLAEEAGLHNGMGFPINGPRMQMAGIALATSQGRASHLINTDLIAAFCNQFYATYRRLVSTDHWSVNMATLSTREREVLVYVAQGKPDAEIANSLLISANTVDFHLRNIFHKLEVNNRVAAAVTALTFGLIEI